MSDHIPAVMKLDTLTRDEPRLKVTNIGSRVGLSVRFGPKDGSMHEVLGGIKRQVYKALVNTRQPVDREPEEHYWRIGSRVGSVPHWAGRLKVASLTLVPKTQEEMDAHSFAEDPFEIRISTTPDDGRMQVVSHIHHAFRQFENAFVWQGGPFLAYSTYPVEGFDMEDAMRDPTLILSTPPSDLLSESEAPPPPGFSDLSSETPPLPGFTTEENSAAEEDTRSCHSSPLLEKLNAVVRRHFAARQTASAPAAFAEHSDDTDGTPATPEPVDSDDDECRPAKRCCRAPRAPAKYSDFFMY